jgi:CHASE2 domain-containing sensor protein
MILRKAWQRTALWLGIGWSLLWSVVLSDLPLIQQLDLGLQDRQIAMGHPSTPPPEILLVTIGEADLKAWPSDREPTIYTDLVQRLLGSGASVVALNLLPNWVQTSDHANNPVKTLVKQHASQIVIVLPTSSAGNPSPSEWRNYEYFLPLNDKGESLFPPRSILGFSEYEPEAKHPLSSNSTARQAYLSGQFTLARHLDHFETLDSAALLSLKKFQPQGTTTDYLPSPSDPIRIHFWGTTGTFPSLNAGSVLRSNAPLPQVRHKIVLVGFSDPSNPEAFAIRSPLGDPMPAIELQANLLGSLLTRSFYRTAPLWLQGIFVVLGGIAISKWIVWGKLNPRSSRKYQYWLFPLVLLGSFALLGAGMFWARFLIPFVLPLTTWVATGLSVLVSLQLGIQKDLIGKQQCEIDRLHRVEQAAIISQTRKLMQRLASHIHEGPLQELKLVMDRLEILQMNFPVEQAQASVDPILDLLESLGHHLRQQINQTAAIALEITPELREGLDAGIKTRLQQLVQSGELTLRVILEIQPLEEPTLDSQWLEAREDIYSFFGEAVKNVVRHAQPPHGTATQVKISLSQQGTRSALAVENDGAKLDDSVFERSNSPGGRGGYGMKLMTAIAAELPEGAVERIVLPEGGLRVTLSWTLQFNH